MRKIGKIEMLIGGICLSVVVGTVSVSAMTGLGTVKKESVATASRKLICDTDGNGTIDLTDANYVLKYSLKIIDVFPDAEADVDADRDGTVSLSDANLALKYALKILDIPENPEESEIPVVSAEPTVTPIQTVTPEPTSTPTVNPSNGPDPIVTVEPTEKVWTVIESSKAMEQNDDEFRQILGDIIWKAESHASTLEAVEKELNTVLYDRCGVVFHVSWFPQEQMKQASAFRIEKYQTALNSGYTYTGQMAVTANADHPEWGWYVLWF